MLELRHEDKLLQESEKVSHNCLATFEKRETGICCDNWTDLRKDIEDGNEKRFLTTISHGRVPAHEDWRL